MLNPSFQTAGLQVFQRGWLSSNNVLFDGGVSHESVLIDSGYCTHAAQTVALVKRALGTRRLGRIVNTHLHSDHCGGNLALQTAFDCAIDIPAGEIDKVDRWDETLLTYRDTGQECPQFQRSGSVRDGDVIHLGSHSWHVISAPGHDPESLVLHQPELQVLISADALWENGFGVVFPELEGRRAFDEVRRTLNRLSTLSVQWIIPGHGSPFQGLAPSLDRAHRRLDAFVADPARHSRHAAKVLIKFHLLAVQRRSLPDLIEWLESTRFMRLSHTIYFGSVEFHAWCMELLEELCASKAISIDGSSIRNL